VIHQHFLRFSDLGAGLRTGCPLAFTEQHGCQTKFILSKNRKYLNEGMADAPNTWKIPFPSVRGPFEARVILKCEGTQPPMIFDTFGFFSSPSSFLWELF